MANTWKDEDTGVTHIRVYSAMTLCGILEGWSSRGQEKVKEKWGVTCESCQEEIDWAKLEVFGKY